MKRRGRIGRNGKRNVTNTQPVELQKKDEIKERNVSRDLKAELWSKLQGWV